VGEIQVEILQVHTTCNMKFSIFCSVRTVIIYLLFAWEQWYIIGAKLRTSPPLHSIL
jgi:hypothetical protein